MTLNGLKCGGRARVERIEAPARVKRRLVDMGVVPGTEVTLKKRAPLGDPIEIALRGYTLTLRTADARGIAVSPLPASGPLPGSSVPSARHLPGR